MNNDRNGWDSTKWAQMKIKRYIQSINKLKWLST